MTSRLRPRGDAGLVHQLLLFVLVSGLAGLLLAGLALPVAGSLGFVARSGADSFKELPADLETPPLPQRSRIVDASGRTLAHFYYENRHNVPLSAVAPVMQKAIVAIEDSRFYEHSGVDVRGTARAFVSNQTGDSVQGGSTLTQQYVKLVLVESALARGDEEAAEAATDRTGIDGYARKLRELRYAVALEDRFSKDEILERYLNIAYFGSGAYGIESAARHFFSRSAKDLTLPQAALLAGLVQAPGAYDPIRQPQRALARRNVVLTRMADLGEITPAEAKKAKASPLGLKVTEIPNGCVSSYAAYFCDFVVETLKNDPAFGETPQDRLNRLLRGGLTVFTTIDPEAQEAAQIAVDENIPRTDPSQIGTAIVMVEPGTGAIRAMAQNRTWGTERKPGFTAINYSVEPEFHGGVGFQAGSTFKAFTAAAAIEQGMSVLTPLPARETMEFDDFENCETGAEFPPYEVSNSTRSAPYFTMRQAIAYSVNTYFVGLEERVTQCAARDMARKLGIRAAHPADQTMEAPGPSFTLGVTQVAPLRMAEAYATFAARGVHCPAKAITKVLDRSGKPIPLNQEGCERVMDKAVADAMNYLLTGVVDGDIPGRTGARVSIGRPAGGKTGTTNDNKDVWFVGYTPQMATAVWVGDPGAPGRERKPLRNIVINGESISAAGGSTVAGPIWNQAMEEVHEDLPELPFAEPPEDVLRGEAIEVPDVRGMSSDRAAYLLAQAGLTATVASESVSSQSVDPGDVAYTSPGAGDSAYTSEAVVLYVSGGASADEEDEEDDAPDPEPEEDPSQEDPGQEDPEQEDEAA